MRSIWEWLLDEKIVLSALAMSFAGITVLLIHWNADKEYVMLFGGFISGLVGALLRGITHQPVVTDSTQTVTSTTVVKPKE
jgi:hypothetical protein